MKKNVIVITTICMLLLSSFMITPAFGGEYKSGNDTYKLGNGSILYVGGSGGENYSTIQAAINDANNGDTVFVYDDSSPYVENVIVNKSINLIGENRDTTVINGSGNGNTVNISADNVNISGFTIKGSTNCTTLQYFDYNNAYWYWTIPDEWGDDYFNMRFTPEGKCKLTMCNFTFYYEDGINGSIVNTTEGVDIIVWDDDGSGFPDTELARVNVHPDNISWYPENTTVDFTSFNLIFDSDFHIGYTTVNQIEDVYAIISDDGSNGTNRSSEYYNGAWSSMWDDWGLDVNFFITADVCYSGQGVHISDSDNCRIINNTVKENKIGVYVDGNSNNNIIYHNNFKDNYQHAYDNGSNIWNDSYPSGGNYWDDYTGEDNFQGPNQNETDSDGIGDTPYNITGDSNKDYYPLMSPYGEEQITITIEDPIPEDGEEGVSIDQPNVSVYISVCYPVYWSNLKPQFSWRIWGDNINTTQAENDTEGRKEANINGTLDLEYNTTYHWYVNVSVEGVYGEAEYYFKTEQRPNQPPVANFSYLATGLKVEFNASESRDPDGTIKNYTWDFGDGNFTYNVTSPVHIFGANESYNVNLTVRDDDGATNSSNQTIDVANARPVVGFDYEPDGKTVTFTSTSYDIDGNLINITWDFGDGNFSYNVTSPVHTYASENEQYDVTLTVTDNLGLSNSTTQAIKTEDTTPPTVEIVKPKRGLYLFNNLILPRYLRPALIIGPITIAVNATDEGGSGVKQVNFYIDPLRSFGIPRGNDTERNESGLYTYNWTRNRPRLFFRYHIIQVEAIDNAGNVAAKQTMIVKRFL